MAEKNKKTFKMPHTFVIMMVIILFATLLTWIIPAGQYVRVENADGVKVVDPNQFSFIDRCPVNPLLIPLYIVNSMCKRVDLMLVIIFSGGAFDLISKSGALHSAVARVAKVFQNRLYIFIPIMTTIFALICTTQGVNQFIAFAPVVVMITLAMGLDSIVGAAIILLGGAVGFATGTVPKYHCCCPEDRRTAAVFRNPVPCSLLCGIPYYYQYLSGKICFKDPQESRVKPNV